MQTLTLRQTTSGGRLGQRGGQVGVALQTDDLFGEVVGLGEVGAPGRHGDDQLVLPVRVAADLLEAAYDGLAAVLDARHAVRVVGGHGDGARRGRRDDLGDAGLGRAAREQHEQVDGALGGGRRGLRVDAALEALGRLGGQLVAARGAGDGHRVEVRGLDDDVGGARDHAGLGVRDGVGDLGVGAAHHTGEADGAPAVGDDQVRGVQLALGAVEGGEQLALLGPADPDGSLDPGAVVGVQRLAELDHHVVGDVDGERDRTHAGLLQPALEPDRRAGLGVEAGHGARGEAVAADRVGDLHRVAVGVGRGHVEQGRVAQRQTVGDGGLAGDAAHRQAVAAVGGDRDVEDLVDEFEQRDGVGADLVLGRQHDDAAGGVRAHAELVAGADHAVRGPAVRLARGDREVTGQHGAGQHHDDLVADGEVAGAADDLLGLAGAVGLADVDRAEADGLLEALQLLDGEDLADDERALEAGAELLDGLDLKAGVDELGLHVAAGLGGRQVDVLPQPGKRDPHQISIPNGRVNRTSPSTMSRMSSTLWRNISIRSMPKPKANPLYFSGSTPQAVEHLRVDHAAAAELDPALGGAGAAGAVRVADGLAAADVADHVHLGGRLGEREEVRPQPGLHVLAEERLDHVVEGALEVGHGEALVDGEQLDLAEDRAVRGVQLVGAVHAAGADHVHRRLAVEQRADLHGRGVRAQHDAGVPRRPRGPARRRCRARCGPGGPGRC